MSKDGGRKEGEPTAFLRPPPRSEDAQTLPSASGALSLVLLEMRDFR